MKCRYPRPTLTPRSCLNRKRIRRKIALLYQVSRSLLYYYSMLDFLLDLIFPRSCVGCGLGGEFICQDCIAKLPLADRDSDDVRALYSYQDETLRKAITKLKYKHGRALAPT